MKGGKGRRKGRHVGPVISRSLGIIGEKPGNFAILVHP